VIILGGHFTNLLLICRMLNQVIAPLGGGFVFFEQKNKVIAWLMRITMEWRGAIMITNKDMRQMINFLKTKKPLFFISDQDFGVSGSVFAPFFNVPTATTKATARLSSLAKAELMPLRYKNIKGTYQLEIEKPLEDYPTKDEISNATKTNQALEEQVKNNIEQYFWAHKRFKTRPNNEQNPY
jgi:KDO2-lipid IV(A) lauroyltransferase